MALPEGEPVSVKGNLVARHRAAPLAYQGLDRRVFALLVVLLIAAAYAWQLSRDPASDPGLSGSDGEAVQSSQTGDIPANQRTVVTVVGPDAIRVVEHLTFTSPTATVALDNPEHVGAIDAFAPRIEDLWVDEGTGRLLTPDPPAPGDSIRVELPITATEVTVGYRATGVVERTAGSAPGRALALVTPLRLADDTGLRAVEVRGVWVDNLGCVDPAGRMAACGRGTPQGWETSPEDAQLLDVVAQLTLPG